MPSQNPNNKGLTPSDQLLGIFAVNFIIVAWVGIAFVFWYETYPDIPLWIYVAEAGILIVSLLSSVLDAVLVRLINIALGRSNDGLSAISSDSFILKFVVVALTVLYIFVLWRILEETGGVASPFAAFLTAPALFAPFVTRNWQTILLLSVLVTAAIVISSETSRLGLDSTWPYKGTAAVMVILAGVLTAIRMWVAIRGAPLTGEGSKQRPGGGTGVEGAGA